MSNPKGGGMASKERLYELWMLYYTKVRASAEELTVTPVVAAGPPAWTFRRWQGRTRSFSVSFVLKAEGKQVSGGFRFVQLFIYQGLEKRVMARYPPDWAV